MLIPYTHTNIIPWLYVIACFSKLLHGRILWLVRLSSVAKENIKLHSNSGYHAKHFSVKFKLLADRLLYL